MKMLMDEKIRSARVRLFTKEGIVMKLKQKQRLERNKITFILGLIILGLLNALTLLGFVDATADKSVVLARMVVNVILSRDIFCWTCPVSRG